MEETIRIRSHPEFYLPGAKIPKPFLAADRQYDEKHKDDPIPVTKVKEIPMPFIKGVEGVNGPIIVTKDWYVKKKKKKQIDLSRDKRDTQIEMMQILSKMDRIKFKIGELDPCNKKDSKKIIALNIDLRDLQAELEMLQAQSGINLNNLEKGTRLARFIGNVKRYVQKRIKKVKRWFRRNRKLILGLISIIGPTAIAVLTRPRK